MVSMDGSIPLPTVRLCSLILTPLYVHDERNPLWWTKRSKDKILQMVNNLNYWSKGLKILWQHESRPDLYSIKTYENSSDCVFENHFQVKRTCEMIFLKLFVLCKMWTCIFENVIRVIHLSLPDYYLGTFTGYISDSLIHLLSYLPSSIRIITSSSPLLTYRSFGLQTFLSKIHNSFIKIFLKTLKLYFHFSDF